jgi:hypothetical protein
MAEETKSDRVMLEELMVSTLAMTDALAKLLIAKALDLHLAHIPQRDR